ncbi:MAG: MarR family transcriptional regulator [Clostridia bacterium]|nr:MarR family transcriptional regulator [Clostridia bacterium]
MEDIRFEKFALLIDGAQKNIQKFKSYIAQELGVKSVHVLWIYELYIHPDGLTSAELAVRSNIDPSLISRELANLKRRGYITKETTPGKRTYNARITLTDEGNTLAKKIYQISLNTQRQASTGISSKDLATFYTVLEKLHSNLNELMNGIESTKEITVQES